MGTWLVEARLQSRLGISDHQLDRIRAGTAGLRVRVVRHGRRHASLGFVVDAASGLDALRSVDVALALSLEARWEVGWETEVGAALR